MWSKVMKQFTTTVLALAAILLTFSNASANEIYITQAGDNLNLTIDQKGDYNLVVSRTITGDNNNITLNQGYEGYNVIGLDINGANNDVTVNQERSNTGGYDTPDRPIRESSRCPADAGLGPPAEESSGKGHGPNPFHHSISLSSSPSSNQCSCS